MPTTVVTHVLNLGGDLDRKAPELARSLGQVTVGATASARAVDKMGDEAQESERETKRLIEQLEKLAAVSSATTIPAMGKLSQGLNLVKGGLAASTAGVSSHILAVGGIAGAWTVAAAGMAAGVVGLVKLTRAAKDWAEELARVGRPIDDVDLKAIQDANKAMDGLAQSTKAFAVTMAGDISGNVGRFSDALSGMAVAADNALKRSDGLMAVLALMAAGPQGGALLGGTGGLVDAFARAGAAARGETGEASLADLPKRAWGSDYVSPPDPWDERLGKLPETRPPWATAWEAWSEPTSQGPQMRAIIPPWTTVTEAPQSVSVSPVSASVTGLQNRIDLQRLAAGISGLGSGTAAGTVAGIGAMTGNPYAAVVGASIQAVQTLGGKDGPAQIRALMKEVTDLPKQLGRIFAKGVPAILANIPEMVTGLMRGMIMLPHQIITGIVEGIRRLFNDFFRFWTDDKKKNDRGNDAARSDAETSLAAKGGDFGRPPPNLPNLSKSMRGGIHVGQLVIHGTATKRDARAMMEHFRGLTGPFNMNDTVAVRGL